MLCVEEHRALESGWSTSNETLLVIVDPFFNIVCVQHVRIFPIQIYLEAWNEAVVLGSIINVMVCS